MTHTPTKNSDTLRGILEEATRQALGDLGRYDGVKAKWFPVGDELANKFVEHALSRLNTRAPVDLDSPSTEVTGTYPEPMTKNSETIDPCKICGGRATCHGQDNPMIPSIKLCRVHCDSCGLSTANYRTRQEAIHHWNTRAPGRGEGQEIPLSGGIKAQYEQDQKTIGEQEMGWEWIPVRAGLPEPGQQVVALRANGSFDRGEISPIWYDGLPGWYMPEGPVTCGSWDDKNPGIVAWMPTPPPRPTATGGITEAEIEREIAEWSASIKGKPKFSERHFLAKRIASLIERAVEERNA